MNPETIRRFWEKVRKDPGGCWVWTASKRAKGYGAFVWADESGKVIQGRAHRFSYELHFGAFDDSLCVLHRCDNPPCVNPDHLFLGTRTDNNADMRMKGRNVRSGTHTWNYKYGDDHWNTKISDGDIDRMKADHDNGMSFSEISKKYGISGSHASRIVKGTRRK